MEALSHANDPALDELVKQLSEDVRVKASLQPDQKAEACARLTQVCQAALQSQRPH